MIFTRLFLLGLLTLFPLAALSADPLRRTFLQEVFPAGVPEPEVIWLIGDTARDYRRIMGREPPQMRLRYWARHDTSAWILETPGKTEPITAGFVVTSGTIREARVLAFRESRGGEIRHAFFLRQFAGISLGNDVELTAPIDGITGATLSVRAMSRMARLALRLERLRKISP